MAMRCRKIDRFCKAAMKAAFFCRIIKKTYTNQRFEYVSNIGTGYAL